MKKLLFSTLILFAAGCGLIKYSVEDVVEIGYESTVYVETQHGHCTGFAIDYDVVVTAAHCIDAPNAFMRFGDEKFVGEVLLDDNELDIAVIHTPERIKNIIPLLTNEHELRDGEILVGVGFPFFAGKDITFNIGSYAGFTRIDGTEILVAYDVCYRGNSGGPVLDSYGRVVGICSRIAPAIDIYDGFHHSHKDINILVPIKKVREILDGKK